MKTSRNLIVFAALNGAMAVALGAFAAHAASPGIKSLLTTGAGYQLVHAVLATAIAVWAGRPGLATLAGWLAAAGGLLFMTSLMMVAYMRILWIGIVTPIGGLLMIGAWLLLAFAAFRTQTTGHQPPLFDET